MIHKRTRNAAGFTLIEILLAVVIAGILLAVAVTRFDFSQEETKADVCDANVAAINTAISAYWTQHDSYPADLTDVTRDPQYFPNGEPKCPFTGKPYDDDYNAKTGVVAKHQHR